jgi:hypothetical protein
MYWSSGCAWLTLLPCFGISKSTAHRRFLIWSRAGVWARLHEAVLPQLDHAVLIDFGWKPVVEGHQTRHDPRNGRHCKPAPSGWSLSRHGGGTEEAESGVPAVAASLEGGTGMAGEAGA